MFSLRRLLLALAVVIIVYLVILFLTTVIAPVFVGVPLVAAVAAFFAQWAVVIAVLCGIAWYLGGGTLFGRS